MKVTLQDIQQARENIRGVIRHTEIDKSISASGLVGSEVFLKLENQQYTGSFKLRGAYNKIASLSENEKKCGVVASSAGNHAQGVAFSATKAGVKSTIVMPLAASLVKIEATKKYGAQVIMHGDVVDDATLRAREIMQKEGSIFIHPYEDEKIIAGQGTIGLEILELIPDLESIIIPIGGGGLISGIATAVKAINPRCRVIGVQSAQADGMVRMFRHDALFERARVSTIADGIAIKKPSAAMYENFISKLVDDVVTVTDDEIAEAIVFLLERMKTVSEGAGAAGMAALMNQKLNLGKKTCIVLSGGNIDLNMVAKIIEKGQLRKGRLCELSVVVDDLPGNLSRMTQAIASLGANVLQVHHDRIAQGLILRETRIEFVLETKNVDHIQQINESLIMAGGRIQD